MRDVWFDSERHFLASSPLSQRLTFPFSMLGAVALTAVTGCSELRGRSHAREGNQLYQAGNYSAAIQEYEQAERLRPGLPAVALNLGLACRQLLIPGAKTPQQERAVECALAAFERLKQLRPDDARADQLFVQTLFDADRFQQLVALYERQLRDQPKDRSAMNGLIQTYSRWDRWNDALHWMRARADDRPGDAEAQYAVGVFAWNRLFQKGGGAEKANYDPRPNPQAEKQSAAAPPAFSAGDSVGQERVQLAELGIGYLQRALAARPKYPDAMIYLNLLYRQKAFAFFHSAVEWQACIDEAERWRQRAQALDPTSKASSR